MNREITETGDWLTIDGCADESLSGKRTIRTAIHRGELKACAINGRGDQRVHRDWLREWMERRAAQR
jgi:excisionase family DNA binding protein